MRRLLLSCSSFALMISSYAQADELNIVTTVKPLNMIVQEITQGVATSETLLPPGVSPHDYALRPSDAKKLHEADLVVWGGPELEMFLTKILDGKENALALTRSEGIDFRHYTDEAHDEHEHEHEHEHDTHHDHDTHAHHEGEHHDEHHGHSHEGIDPHLWLGPNQAVQAASAVAQKLIEIDPLHKQQYEANLSRFAADVKSARADITKQLEPVADHGYFVFHDGYGYFEQSFGLNQLGHFTVEPDRRPGAKTLIAIRSSLKDAKAKCVFSEPQFSPAVVDSVVRGTGVKIETLDPMATDIAEGQGGYTRFLRQLGNTFAQCLTN